MVVGRESKVNQILYKSCLNFPFYVIMCRIIVTCLFYNNIILSIEIYKFLVCLFLGMKFKLGTKVTGAKRSGSSIIVSVENAKDPSKKEEVIIR